MKVQSNMLCGLANRRVDVALRTAHRRNKLDIEGKWFKNY